MPLRSDLGDIARVLGGISLKGGFGRTPRRLTITGQSRRSLVGYAALPGEETGLTGRFDERRRERTPHLRLVVVNDR